MNNLNETCYHSCRIGTILRVLIFCDVLFDVYGQNKGRERTILIMRHQ